MAWSPDRWRDREVGVIERGPDKQLRLTTTNRGDRWVVEFKVWRCVRNTAERDDGARFAWRATNERIHVRPDELEAVGQALRRGAEYARQLDAEERGIINL